MNVTSTGLARAAGAAAATAGAIFIAVQVNHPAGTAFDTETTEWVVRSCAKTVMAVLALVGITGLWLRQHRQAGMLGLVGYVVLAIGYLAILTVQVIAATVLPTLLDSDPGYVLDVVHAAEGGVPAGDIGAVHVVLNVSGVGYILGGLLFGIALFRAGVPARWAGVLLAYGTVAALALSALPESFNRPFAVPVGLALIGLGVALWRDQRHASGTVDTPSRVLVAEPAAR